MEKYSPRSQPFLPDGIIIDILSRLPVKSLHRFKSVSTQFLHWISTDPQILNLHATRRRQRRRIAVLVTKSPPSSVALRSLSANTLDDPTIINLCNDFKYSYPSTRIWNSCNGLVLISISDKSFFAWNPSTRRKQRVGFSPSFSLFASARRYCLLGLGFDEISNGHKVIAANQDNTGDSCSLFSSSLGGTTAGRYSKKIVDFPYRICQDTPGSNVGGNLYWMVVGKTCDDPVIIGFDFGAEVFIETTQPRWEPGVLQYGLGVLGELLCVVCHGEESVEVLGLKKDGTVESWERLFIVPYDMGGMQFRRLTPLCFTEDGEVVMEIDRKRLVVCNLDEKSYRWLSDIPPNETEEYQETLQTMQGLRLNENGFKVVVYVESLVPPFKAPEAFVNGPAAT